MKCIRKNGIDVVLLIMVIVCATVMILVCSLTTDIALANTQDDKNNVYALCEEFTDDVDLQNDADKIVQQYEEYIDERFEIGNMKAAEGITDEWIFQIVPKAVFDMQPDDFLYIGIEYGFYVDYDSTADSYLVYLMLHTYDNESTSGHIVRQGE